MLDSLLIEGFRAFERLEVARLGRVNLLVGRNSVGKSTVLEAVRLWASWPVVKTELARLLERRQEFIEKKPYGSMGGLDWDCVFHAPAGGASAQSLEIGPTGDEERTLSVRLGHGRHDAKSEAPGWSLLKKGHEAPIDSVRVLVSERGRTRQVQPLDHFGPLDPTFDFARRTPEPGSVCIALSVEGFGTRKNDSLWQAVNLTDAEHHVIRALRLIDANVEGLAFVDSDRFVDDGNREERVNRVAMIKRHGRAKEPLRRLGDGIERLLQLILALVNARGGILLLDEVENGIHYRVQPDLWRLIFTVAAELDVQVFAATHSWDCITAFQQAAADHPADGVLIKLERDAHGARAKVFDEDDLAVITHAEIEVR